MLGSRTESGYHWLLAFIVGLLPKAAWPLMPRAELKQSKVSTSSYLNLNLFTLSLLFYFISHTANILAPNHLNTGVLVAPSSRQT